METMLLTITITIQIPVPPMPAGTKEPPPVTKNDLHEKRKGRD